MVSTKPAAAQYYHAANRELLDHNMDEIDAYKKDNRYAQRKMVATQLLHLWSFPHWIAVVNIEALTLTIDTIYRQFASLPKDFSGDKLIARILKDQKRRRSGSRGVR